VPVVKYGTREIYYSHIIDKSLKHAYIIVDFYEGVILKSPPIDESRAKEAVYKKGKWILEKLKLVERMPQGEIVTGSRLLYLGKRYYVQVLEEPGIKGAAVTFNHSRFKIYVNPDTPDRMASISGVLETFSREKAVVKITPRIKKWSLVSGLIPTVVNFRKLAKRWGSCSSTNEITINFDAVKLPFTLIDYILVHELVHIKHKDHSKEFYREVVKFLPDWKELDDKLCGMKL